MEFDSYLKSFDYAQRQEMKINIQTLLSALQNGEAILVDIRFKEEVSAWSFGFARSIPLTELPGRFHELDKNKLIFTAAHIMTGPQLPVIFLTLQGYHSKYLQGFDNKAFKAVMKKLRAIYPHSAEAAMRPWEE